MESTASASVEAPDPDSPCDAPDETTPSASSAILLEAPWTDRIGVVRPDKALSVLIGACMVSEGTIVDATIIHAPSSTKNKEGKRDPEMASTKKGNTWHFGIESPRGLSMPKGQVLHSVVLAISGSLLPSLFFVDDGAWMIVASTIVPSLTMHAPIRKDSDLSGRTRPMRSVHGASSKRAELEEGVVWSGASQGESGAGASTEADAVDSTSKRAIACEQGSNIPLASSKTCWGYRKVRYRGLHQEHGPSLHACSPWPTSDSGPGWARATGSHIGSSRVQFTGGQGFRQARFRDFF